MPPCWAERSARVRLLEPGKGGSGLPHASTSRPNLNPQSLRGGEMERPECKVYLKPHLQRPPVPLLHHPCPRPVALTVLCWVVPSRLKWRSTYCEERR